MRKRLTAILLSLSLALGLAPQIPASAEENIEFYEEEGVRTGLKSITIDPYTYYNVFYPQIGVGKRLDGGRRRVKKYLWSF